MGDKKNTVKFTVFFLIFWAECALIFAKGVPELLDGVWENETRYVVFNAGNPAEGNSAEETEAEGNPAENENENDSESSVRISLKTFYGWYDDRAVEDEKFSRENPRETNDATQKNPAGTVTIKFVPLTDELFMQAEKSVVQDDGDILTAENFPSGAWNLEMKFSGQKEIYRVPVAVLDGKLYLNFLIKTEDSDNVSVDSSLNGISLSPSNPLLGFWQDFGSSSGILSSPPWSRTEIFSYFVTDSFVYKIRYWRTDMEFDGEKKALFSDGSETFSVPKHLRVAGETFTCVTGRRTRIRSVEKSTNFPQPFVQNSVLVQKKRTDENQNEISYSVKVATICALGEPYLTNVPGRTLEEIIAENKTKPRPEAEPLFPPRGILNFDRSIVNDESEDFNRRMLDWGK